MSKTWILQNTIKHSLVRRLAISLRWHGWRSHWEIGITLQAMLPAPSVPRQRSSGLTREFTPSNHQPSLIILRRAVLSRDGLPCFWTAHFMNNNVEVTGSGVPWRSLRLHLRTLSGACGAILYAKSYQITRR